MKKTQKLHKLLAQKNHKVNRLDVETLHVTSLRWVQESGFRRSYPDSSPHEKVKINEIDY
jgi:hypothetical protein